MVTTHEAVGADAVAVQDRRPAPTLSEMAAHADAVLQSALEKRFAADTHLFAMRTERARRFAAVESVGAAIVVFACIEEEVLALYQDARRAIEARFGVVLTVVPNSNPWVDRDETRCVRYTPSAVPARRFAVHLVPIGAGAPAPPS